MPVKSPKVFQRHHLGMTVGKPNDNRAGEPLPRGKIPRRAPGRSDFAMARSCAAVDSCGAAAAIIARVEVARRRIRLDGPHVNPD